MQIVSANVLDKNEKCINFVEITVPDDIALTTAKALLQAEGQPFRCRHCFDEHTFEGALFAHQKVINWDGKTETTKTGNVARKIVVSSEWSKPLGNDEFTMTVKKMELTVDRNADGITIKDYQPAEVSQ